MAFRRKNTSSSTTTSETAAEAAARLPKTMPTRDEQLAHPDNPHSNQYSARSGGYTNREQRPTPGMAQMGARRWNA